MIHIAEFILIPFVFGLAAGGLLTWLVAQARFRSLDGWADHFRALAADTLRANNESFLQLAESRLKQTEQASAATLDKKATAFDEMVKPVKETLQKMDTQLQALEVKREGAYQALTEAVKLTHETHQQLRTETGRLLQALRTPNSRGRWGEIQLKRILEMTGMSAHAKDFEAQATIADGALRPDYIVHLPGDRCIVIDSKVPLASYLDAVQSNDELSRKAALLQHARQVREHVKALSAKAYWDQVEGTPEFVVLFLPGDHFLAAALDDDSELMDFSVTQKVILATPMTLIALLRTVAYGWRQESLRDNTRRIGELGSDLYSALATMSEHIAALGGKLSGSLDSYNKMVGSYERNVLNKARKLKEYGAAKDGKDLPEELEPIDLQPRQLTAVAEEKEADKQDAA
jgi:DNA recombination protein RmuC